MSKELTIETRSGISTAVADSPVNGSSPCKTMPTGDFPGQPFQMKLSIGGMNDALEQEADAAADKVMMPQTEFIQRKCADCEEQEKVHRRPLASFIRKKEIDNSTAAPDSLSSQINSSKGNGSAMDSGTKTFMETRFGSDFSGIKIHTGNEAIQMSRDLQAKAFTTGNDIFFNEGQYHPHSDAGKHLLAHELTHVLQQSQLPARAIQRTMYGGATMGVPSDWEDQVKKATTSAQKLVLIQNAVGSAVKVHDKTAASAKDTKPNPDHLLPYTASSNDVNFIDNLDEKESVTSSRKLSQNVGYTFFHKKQNYVILGGKDLIKPKDYYSILQTLNHEFDHVRQNNAGSKLQGNSSELDAWVSSFIREFHHSYKVSESGGKCTITQTPQNSPLLGYYVASGVQDSEKKNAVTAISTHYNNVLAKHSIHMQAFKLWIYRSLKYRSNPKLAEDLNAALKLGIASDQDENSYMRFPCSNIASLDFSAPAVDKPVFPPKP